jgi:RNA polymerase sigma factor (sigma-70 family)
MSSRAACPSLCDLEVCFEALRQLVAAGVSYTQAEPQVLAFFRHPALAGLCRMAAWRIRARPHDREDLVQTVLLSLLQKVRDGFGSSRPLLGYRPEAGHGKHPFAGWLYTVLLNACRLAHRPLSRYTARVGGCPSLLAEVASRPDTSSEAHERLLAVTRAIHELPDGPRLVLLGYLAGKSGNDLAEEMARSATWVSRQKKRGIQLLRRVLNPEAVG